MWYEKVVLVLAAIGAINWGLVAITGNDAVMLLLGWAGEITVSIVYYVVALCGIYALIKAFK